MCVCVCSVHTLTHRTTAEYGEELLSLCVCVFWSHPCERVELKRGSRTRAVSFSIKLSLYQIIIISPLTSRNLVLRNFRGRNSQPKFRSSRSFFKPLCVDSPTSSSTNFVLMLILLNQRFESLTWRLRANKQRLSLISK